MRALLQRVSSARVEVDGCTVGAIGPGILVFLGVARDDTDQDAQYLADRVLGLRMFSDDAGKMNLSVTDTGGSLLVVSQFTLYGDCTRGRRPGFSNAAPAELANCLYERFIEFCRSRSMIVAAGVFQASMVVSLANEGPVTFLVESRPKEQ
jgi:D-aminoacyl-tRNA deacylase